MSIQILLSLSPLHFFVQKIILFHSHQIWYLSYHFRSFLNSFISPLLLYKFIRDPRKGRLCCVIQPPTYHLSCLRLCSNTMFQMISLLLSGKVILYIPLNTPFQTIFHYIMLLLLYMPFLSHYFPFPFLTLKSAIDEEMSALHQNQTWELSWLSDEKHAVGCRWMYTIKYHSDDSVECLKARLVVKEYTKTYDVDYMETFSHVTRLVLFAFLSLWQLIANDSCISWTSRLLFCMETCRRMFTWISHQDYYVREWESCVSIEEGIIWAETITLSLVW